LILECLNLSKFYGRHRGVEDISFEIREHDVFALLGPNGSGKSTLIKMITGLIWPNSGRVLINGHDVHQEHCQALRRVGAIVEWPSFIPYLSARRNLEIFTGSRDEKFQKRMLELLDFVNMSSRIDDMVQNFSTGMKQRLGLALALLPESEFIILDEPTNGLDPNGIIETRKMILDFNKEFGTTILFTSHLLGEVEQICGRLAIIHKGSMVAYGLASELLHGENIAIIASPFDKTLDLLKKISSDRRFGITSVEKDGEKIVIKTVSSEISPDINALLVNSGIRVSSICVRKQSLEEYFMKVTDGETDVA